MEALIREELLAEIARLEAENAQYHALVEELRAEMDMLRSQLSGKTGGSGAAPFIKPNRKERREAERQARIYSWYVR